jgi:F-type H+-transporting ATPase subunit gamma
MFLKEIKQKINSTQRISQVTGALELISAVKMRKSQKIALGSRPFAQKVIEILKRLSEYQQECLQKNSFYFHKRELKKVLIVIVTSDKGFCSSFNKNILKFAEKEINKTKELFKREKNTAPEIEIMAVGKKAIAFAKKKKFKVKVEFTGIGDYGKLQETKPIADLLLRYFQEDQYQRICVFYTDFVSSFVQKPRKMQLLPLCSESFKEILRESASSADSSAEEAGKSSSENKLATNKTGKPSFASAKASEGRPDYVLEPSPGRIFESLVPQLLEFEIYHIILEANASEHSARMMAMRNACENANDIIKDLTLNYNKVRQNQITAEVCEISSAKEAMN